MTVERMWNGPEMLKPNLSKVLVLRTCGMDQSYSSLACRSYTCWTGEEHMSRTVEEHLAALSLASLTRGMVQSYASLPYRSYTCWTGEEHRAESSHERLERLVKTVAPTRDGMMK